MNYFDLALVSLLTGLVYRVLVLALTKMSAESRKQKSFINMYDIIKGVPIKWHTNYGISLMGKFIIICFTISAHIIPVTK